MSHYLVDETVTLDKASVSTYCRSPFIYDDTTVARHLVALTFSHLTCLFITSDFLG